MLPPFVPPSARAAAETLPLITEFVIDRVERSFGATFAAAPQTGVEVVQRADSAPEATTVVEAIETSAIAPTSAETLPSIQEFIARPAAAVSPLADIAPEVQAPAAPVAPLTSLAAEDIPPALAETSEADWVDAERNAFDWQSVASLAHHQDEAQRADDEWGTTDWDAPSESGAEHVASVLTQLARRVRTGELKVETRRGASVEATVASILAALLTDPEGSAVRDDR